MKPPSPNRCESCCGSAGMVVQSEEFVESHRGQLGDISVYGQVVNRSRRRLAAMRPVRKDMIATGMDIKPLERQPNVAFDNLSVGVALGRLDEDTLTTVVKPKQQNEQTMDNVTADVGLSHGFDGWRQGEGDGGFLHEPQRLASPPRNAYTFRMSHEVHDQISLELARRVTARLRQSPGFVALARKNLARWSRVNAGAPSLLRCYDEWRGILARPVDEICAMLCAETEQGQRLRQNSPFAGVLSPAEVWEIKSRFRRHAATPA